MFSYLQISCVFPPHPRLPTHAHTHYLWRLPSQALGRALKTRLWVRQSRTSCPSKSLPFLLPPLLAAYRALYVQPSRQCRDSQGRCPCAWGVSGDAEPGFGPRHHGSPGNVGEGSQDGVVVPYSVLQTITHDLHQSSGTKHGGTHRNVLLRSLRDSQGH